MKKNNLFLKVAIGFALGILFGAILPEISIKTKVIGDIYLNLIKLMIIPIVSVAVFCGIANISDGVLLKKIGFRTVFLYVIMFVASAIVSLSVANIMKPGLGATFTNAPVYEGAITTPTVSSFLLNIVPTNIIKACADGNTLPVILFMIFLAIAVLSCKEAGKPVIEFANSLSLALFKMLGYIMELSPVGVMSLMAFSVAQYGVGIFSVLAKYILTCWLACILVFIIVMVIPTCIYTGISPMKLLKACGKVALVSMSTTSSAATLPTTLSACVDDLNAPKGISQFTLSLGSTINMCGGACSFCCLAIFVSDFYSLNLSIPTLALIIVTATLLNMAAPGIPGGGIVLGASFLSIVGLPFDLMGPISGFYRLLDMAFTTINVEGDLIANLIVSKSVGEWDPKDQHSICEGV
ncbi:amino acid:cation symporter [Candidatus Epulonipiscium fishelsonii]|uniref:Amino acid:cation symporter n=1 Tax=Candidatus Epulonipiscium fishelsonii TaxID=77094 RepID=A0ACC8XJB3_9FIRM|nr:amino acid:cation symporter [Epulopiscium sp. SCG-D08WGA-EpuloA1]OON91510.1 MAG: amino acid:cation symporter [Epulopiscium sp. AS2M-Bin002]